MELKGSALKMVGICPPPHVHKKPHPCNNNSAFSRKQAGLAAAQVLPACPKANIHFLFGTEVSKCGWWICLMMPDLGPCFFSCLFSLGCCEVCGSLMFVLQWGPINGLLEGSLQELPANLSLARALQEAWPRLGSIHFPPVSVKVGDMQGTFAAG